LHPPEHLRFHLVILDVFSLSTAAVIRKCGSRWAQLPWWIVVGQDIPSTVRGRICFRQHFATHRPISLFTSGTTGQHYVHGAVAERRIPAEDNVESHRGADKTLARPGRKQATATTLARRLTCFLSASVTRKVLQFGT